MPFGDAALLKSLAGSQHASQARHVHSTDISDDATGQPKESPCGPIPACPEGGGCLTAPAFPRAMGRKSRRWPIGCSIRTPARCAPATRAAQAKGAEVAEATTRGVAGALLRGFERCASLAARRQAAVQGVVVGWRAWTGSRARGHCGGAFAGGRGLVGRPPVRFATAMACARAVVAGWRVVERHVRDVLAPPGRNAARPARGAGPRPRAGRRDVPARTRPCPACATPGEGGLGSRRKGPAVDPFHGRPPARRHPAPPPLRGTGGGGLGCPTAAKKGRVRAARRFPVVSSTSV